MKFIFLVGLPGSGKTYLGRQMCDQFSGGLFLDDICQTCGKERLKEPFHTETVIVADPSLCRSYNRPFAEAMVREHHPDCEVEWIFFENDWEKCWANVQRRNDGRIIGKHILKDKSRGYTIPQNVKTLPVWSGE